MLSEDKGPGFPVTGFLALFKRFPDDLGVEIRPFSSFVYRKDEMDVGRNHRLWRNSAY